MTPRLLSPTDAAASLTRHLNKTWAERVCAEILGDPQSTFTCAVRPSISGSAAVERIGFDNWHDWRMAWKKSGTIKIDGAVVGYSDVIVAGQRYPAPQRISVSHLEAGLQLLEHLEGGALSLNVDRARTIGGRLHKIQAALSPQNLKASYSLADPDVDILVDAIVWLRENSDLSGWTARQLPVPGMHTKWLSSHRGLLRSLSGRDLFEEARPRLSVVNFSYVDPGYLATGGRRHDVWTTGDSHALAYEPRTVLIVENRDSRLWFPPTSGTIVVEGSGKAAASSLSGVDWLVNAERIVYWGDIDADGYAILDNFRTELSLARASIDSILMDEAARARYAHLGVNRDKRGDLLSPSTLRLKALTPEEASGYASVATAGKTQVRRIEQERIPMAHAVAALQELLSLPLAQSASHQQTNPEETLDEQLVT